MATRPKQHIDTAFRLQCRKYYLEKRSQKTAKQMAKELGIGESTLWRWGNATEQEVKMLGESDTKNFTKPKAQKTRPEPERLEPDWQGAKVRMLQKEVEELKVKLKRYKAILNQLLEGEL